MTWLIFISCVIHMLPKRSSLNLSVLVFLPVPVAQSVECLLCGTGGQGFNPRPRHIKVIRNGTSCASLGTQTYRVELGLVDLVSG